MSYETLFETRAVLRQAYVRIRQMRQDDPTVRATLDQLDLMCVGITHQMDALEPVLFPMVMA